MVAELISRVAQSAKEPRKSVPASMRADPAPKIDDAAIELLEKLPSALRLVGLRGQFPRVLNRIAKVWSDPPKFGAMLDSLLIDERGSREGFPFEVVKEITELRRYYFSMVHPEWRGRFGEDGSHRFR